MEIGQRAVEPDLLAVSLEGLTESVGPTKRHAEPSQPSRELPDGAGVDRDGKV